MQNLLFRFPFRLLRVSDLTQASWYEYSRRPPQGLLRTAGPDEGDIHATGFDRGMYVVVQR